MTTKWQQMFEAGKRLIETPLSFTDQMKFFEARQEWRVFTWGYERMVRHLPEPERTRLRELTMQPLDLNGLKQLPEGTFGREYAEFFASQHVSPSSYTDAWPAMRQVVERSWIVRRSLKLHDMHHVLLGSSCDPFGEWTVTAFTTRNSHEPNQAFTMLGLPLVAHLFGDVGRVLRSVYEGWRMAGRVERNLFLAPLEEMLDQPIEQVRQRYGIPRACEA